MSLRRTCLRGVAAFSAVVVSVTAFAGADMPQSAVKDQLAPEKAKANMALSARGFTENTGQWDPRARFLSRTPNFDVWVTREGVTFDYFRRSPSKDQRRGHVVNMSFVGGKPGDEIVGVKDTGSKATFQFGNRSSSRPATRYEEVLQKNVYAGIDARHYLDGGNPRYDLIVNPNVAPDSVRMKFDGAESVDIRNGEIVLGTSVGEFKHGAPFAYQVQGGKKVQVPARFVKKSDGTIAFDLGKYDRSKTLVIDPLVYGSYYGGEGGNDEVRNVVADLDGGVYLVGSTAAPDFPALQGPYGFNLAGGRDMFVAKLQGDAYSNIYAAYIGGTGDDFAQFARLDSFGNLWVAGRTTSPVFANNTRTPSAASDVFVMRFGRDSASILSSDPADVLFVGGTGTETLAGFDLQREDNAPAGTPVRFGFAGNTTASIPDIGTMTGTNRGYIVRFEYSNGSFTRNDSASKYVEAGVPLTIGGFSIDRDGDAYLTGTVLPGNINDNDPTGSGRFLTTPGIFEGGNLLRRQDVFVRKYGQDGSIILSGLIGGNGNDTIGGQDFDLGGTAFNSGSAIAVDFQKNIYVTGIARSFNFPRTPGVYGETFNASPVMFVTKVSPDGSRLVYSTNLRSSGNGPRGGVFPAGIAVDAAGNAYVSGNLHPNYLNFPATPGDPNEPNGTSLPSVQLRDALDAEYTTPATPNIPSTEGFLNVLNPTGTDLVFGTYIGGLLDDMVYGPYVDRFGDVWVNGWTDSARGFMRVSSDGNTVNIYNDSSSLPGSLISPLAFKATPAAGGGTPQTTLYGAYLDASGNAHGPGFINATYQRDGFLIKLRVGATPNVQSVVLNPNTVPGGLGATSTGVVTLSSAAPAGGADVEITLDAATFGSLTPTGSTTSRVVTIPAGATQGTFTVYTRPVVTNSAIQVRATYLGSFQNRQLNVVPWLQSLNLTPTDLVGGNVGSGRVTLAAPAGVGGVTVDLATDTPSLISFPSGTTILVPEGQSSAVFPIATQGVATQSRATVTASLLGVSRTQTITLNTANLSTLTFSPPEVAGLGTTTGTITLNGRAGSAFTVNLSMVNSPAGYTFPPTVTFAPGSTSATFLVTTPVEPTQVTRRIIANRPVQGGYEAGTVDGSFTVITATLANFAIAPATVNSGGTATGTITLNSAAPTGGVVVNIESNSAFVTAPGSVTVPAGASTVSFPIVARVLPDAVTTTLTARRGTESRAATLTINAATFGLTVSPSSVIGPGGATGTVTLNSPAGPGGFEVQLSTSHESVTVPNTVTVPQGQTSVTFPIATGEQTQNRTVIITARVGTREVTASLVVRTVGVASVQFLPSSRVRGGQTVNMLVTLDAPARANTVVQFNVSNGGFLVVPLSPRTVPAGQTSVIVPVTVRRVSRNQIVTVTASLPGASATESLLITR